jgi:hypothetical protein
VGVVPAEGFDVFATYTPTQLGDNSLLLILISPPVFPAFLVELMASLGMALTKSDIFISPDEVPRNSFLKSLIAISDRCIFIAIIYPTVV